MSLTSTNRLVDTDNNVLWNNFLSSNTDFILTRDNMEAKVTLTDSGAVSIKRQYGDPQAVSIQLHFDKVHNEKSSFVKKLKTAGSVFNVELRTPQEVIKKSLILQKAMGTPSDSANIVTIDVVVVER